MVLPLQKSCSPIYNTVTTYPGRSSTSRRCLALLNLATELTTSEDLLPGPREEEKLSILLHDPRNSLPRKGTVNERVAFRNV